MYSLKYSYSLFYSSFNDIRRVWITNPYDDEITVINLRILRNMINDIFTCMSRTISGKFHKRPVVMTMKDARDKRIIKLHFRLGVS